ncbi:MAG: adenylyltransferase/cytidyltransferase family protein [Haloarculaceae archaeon]
MIRVMTQGTFNILHPGHLHYLRESRDLGDERYVVIGRGSRMSERKDLFMHEDARRQVVDALAVVDEAILESEGSIFDTVARVDPDIITLGHHQAFDIDELEAMLTDHGYSDVRVVRIEAFEPESEEMLVSSSAIKEKLDRVRAKGVEPDTSGCDDPTDD